MHENYKSKMSDTLFGQKSSRRDFLRNSAVTALAGTALAACSTDKSGAQSAKVSDADHSGGTMAPNPAPISPAAAAEAMDKMHEAGIKAFPAKTAGKGNQLMQPRMAPGERWDVIVNCNNPGTWAFHCHILPHAESDHGMFGMVTALIVK